MPSQTIKTMSFTAIKALAGFFARLVSRPASRIRLGARLAAVPVVCAATLFVAAPAFAINPLPNGQVLGSGKSMTSPSGEYTLAMQADGRLVLYENSDGWHRALWAKPDTGWQPGDYLKMDTDGSLFLYKWDGSYLWGDETYNHFASGSYPDLRLFDSGDLQVVSNRSVNGMPAQTTVWHTGTTGTRTSLVPTVSILKPGQTLTAGQYLMSAPTLKELQPVHGDYKLVMQADGNLVLYRVYDWRPVWWSGTDHHPGAYAQMQLDGNLVVYSCACSSRVALWSAGISNTSYAGAYLHLTKGGTLVIRTKNYEKLWSKP